MKNMEIEIGDMQYDILDKHAKANKISTKQYMTNILVSWANSHIEGSFAKKLKTKTYQELKQMLGDPDV